MAETILGASQLQARLRAISPQHGGSRIMTNLAKATVREAKILVPHKTRNLSRSIHVAEVTASSARVVASAKYAPFVEYGTRPHEITPNAKKALRWAATAGGARLTGTPRKGAAVVFAKRVHHPGTRPYPFLVPGARKALGASGLAAEIVAEWNQAG